MVVEYRATTIEFPTYNMAQRIRHSTPQALARPSRRPDILESAA